MTFSAAGRDWQLEIGSYGICLTLLEGPGVTGIFDSVTLDSGRDNLEVSSSARRLIAPDYGGTLIALSAKSRRELMDPRMVNADDSMAIRIMFRICF